MARVQQFNLLVPYFPGGSAILFTFAAEGEFDAKLGDAESEEFAERAEEQEKLVSPLGHGRLGRRS